MTTSETLYRAEELFHEELKRKTNWGRNELILIFQSCIRKALGESLDAIEYTGGNKPSIRPKGDGSIKLYGQPDNTIVSDEHGSHEIREISVEDSENDYDTHRTASEEDGNPF